MTVAGTIGNQPVILNNAATESTLQQLLQAVQGAGGAGAAQQVASTAAIAGINAAGPALNTAATAATGMARAGQVLGTGLGKLNNASDILRTSFEGLEKNIGALTSKLMQGTAAASDVYEVFTKLPGIVGAAATVFQKVSQFQEDNLKTYQQISTAGVNFGGSLTQMRMAAQNSYVTLQEFTNLMKNNSETFSKMGGTVNQGAMAFTKLSNSLLKSEAGDDLRALGYTTEQVNQGLVDYIGITGGRTRREMQNTEALTKGAAQYLEQLDGLSQLTGESREQLAQKMKEDAANQAWQSYLLTLDEEGRKKANAAKVEAEVRGGKGAGQALQAQLMGLPPMTREAQAFVGTMKNANQGVNALAAGVKDSSKSADDIVKMGAGVTAGLARDGRELSNVANAQIMAGGENAALFGRAVGAANQATQRNIKSVEDQIAFETQAKKDAEERKKSEAAAAVKAEKAVQEMGQSLMAMLLPAIKALTPVVNTVTTGLGDIIETVGEMEGAGKAAIAAFIGFQAFKRIGVGGAGGAAAGIPGVGGVLGGVLGGGGLGPLGSANNPMHVIIARRLPGAQGTQPGQGRGPQAPGTPPAPGTPTPGTPSGGPSKIGRLAGGVGGIVGGLALDAAAAKLTESGNEKAGAGVGILGDAATWAGAGAMLGPWGALAGGLAGGAYGLYKNWDKLFGDEKKMANGGIVTQPTNILAGEAGSEAIVPLKHLESLRAELETLNKSTIEMIRYMRETADYTKKNVDATKGLSGDLFKF